MKKAILFLILLCSTPCSADTVSVVIAAEACGEGEIGMQAVANVIANRSRSWNKTPMEIVSQRNQFFGYTASNRHRLYTQCREAADRLAMKILDLPDITGGALYFRQPNENIRAWHGDETVRIKGHIFHRERE